VTAIRVEVLAPPSSRVFALECAGSVFGQPFPVAVDPEYPIYA
jgi:hypothetical protein